MPEPLDCAAPIRSTPRATRARRRSDGRRQAGAAERAADAPSEADAPRKKPSASAESAEQRREALAAQRAAQRRCERQYAEAARACKQIGDLVLAKPDDARATRPRR